MTTFATPQPITASLSTAGARVRVTATERPDTVVLVEPIDGTSKADAKVAERTTVEFTDGLLSVKTRKAGAKSGSVAITIGLPAGSRLVLNTAWSDVHADGQLGDCELALASGRVKLDRIATLRGNLGAGEVEVGYIAGTADLDGGTAGLRIGELGGTMPYRGSSGEVSIRHARSDVALTGSGGRFDIDHAEGDVLASTGNCPIRIGRMTGGQAELTNSAGGIEVGIGEGSTAQVDAESTKGNVRDELSTSDAVPQVKVHARTRLDDIVIHHAR
ncbi:hypothetical protein [Amycolatopsis albispora]|uniref:Adhesin domain-containing protein n=1 Tax=Amycolatopsis albispora TaxID=1804986 RepID=A0A344L8W1_9PSEU|nr:hypothetical protein [Amycolatopsis albispora]AXB44485.1 hypothetical protein A4R43_19835 [Amycolatopsis albispora]